MGGLIVLLFKGQCLPMRADLYFLLEICYLIFLCYNKSRICDPGVVSYQPLLVTKPYEFILYGFRNLWYNKHVSKLDTIFNACVLFPK